MKSITLNSQEGTSDKVYRLSVEAKEEGFVVNFEYGRRGSKLRTGTKTASPVTRSVAERIFNEVVADKLTHGYIPDIDGAEIDVLTQTKPGRHLVREFASALQNELWVREYGHSWGVREEFAKVVEDHPELLELQISVAADTILRNLSAWSPVLAEKEAIAKARYVSPEDVERNTLALNELLRAIKVKISVGPEIADVFVGEFNDEFTSKHGKKGIRALLHGGRIVEILETEEAAMARAYSLIERIGELGTDQFEGAVQDAIERFMRASD